MPVLFSSREATPHVVAFGEVTGFKTVHDGKKGINF
jgi:hypothetical protein